MTKNYLFLAFLWLFICESGAQSIFDIDRELYSNAYHHENFSLIDNIQRRNTNTTPPKSPVRPMAEWEEVDAITITWINYFTTLSEIVKHAQKEVKVYINCPGSAQEVKDQLESFGVEYGNNVIFLEHQDVNSVWIRDYGPNSAYINDVDSLIMVDWVYNRDTRPDDDKLPQTLADHIDVPLFETVEGDFRLTATGGNFMSDGIETGFSSRLVLDENEDKKEYQIDQIMSDFLGINEYVKFDKLVYDGIHHIDMHMKLLDEERIIFGEYPEGKGDHDIIEANIEYLMSTQKNAFGEPYEIVRIPMPPNFDNSYPGEEGEAYFRTYTNALFINKTILVPTYQTKHDTTALRIWNETMPGYNIVGIRCNTMIPAFGAIHCVTKEIGAKDPIRIVFQKIKDQNHIQYDGYPLVATIQHKTGISSATLFFREKGTTDYDQIPMQRSNDVNDQFEARIPNIIDGGSIEYYVEATAKSGKVFARPQPAPRAYYSFDVNFSTSVNNTENVFAKNAFPNPSNDLVYIPLELTERIDGDLSLFDIHGKRVAIIHSGSFPSGTSKHFINVAGFASGVYSIRLSTKNGVSAQKLVVSN